MPKRPGKVALKNLFLPTPVFVVQAETVYRTCIDWIRPNYTVKWVESLQKAGTKALRVGADELTRPNLKEWLKTECAQYEVVIAASSARADSIEGKMLMDHFDNIALSIRGERLHDLDYLRSIKANIAIIVINE